MEEEIKDMHYLKLLSKSFPTIAQASTEIINLQAILSLPKGTEHFLADIHGEYEAFHHVLKNASGNIRRKVYEIFGNEMRESEKRELCALIYYPEQKLELIKEQETNMKEWYLITMQRLLRICSDVSGKYTRSKVRKVLPPDFAYIIEELLHESNNDDIDKTAYVNTITETIISTRRADDFIIAMSNVIQRLIIDKLHILGDIYDRGPGAHIIMDTLQDYHNWDIQWGNHDVLWMGAAAGNEACICNVIRLSLRYGNLATLEEGYGINLVPLATVAMELYGDDPCTAFLPKMEAGNEMDEKTTMLTARMHKAITVMQFKLENQLFKKHPEWKMQDRDLLSKIDYDKGTCNIDGKEYKMKTCNFPTIDPNNPNELSEEEQVLIKRLKRSFVVSEKLHRHIGMILSHGCMYKVCNGNLLFHASVPLNEDGSMKEVQVYKNYYKGKDLLHHVGMFIRSAFQDDTEPEEREYARDYFLYLWAGPDSPLFDKSKMATFERYFLSDKETFVEDKGAYYTLRNKPEICDSILDAFEVTGENRHIINGHVPVHVSSGESPIRADGKLMVIDGGFSKPYHDETGISGYTLIYHSRGFQLVQHDLFTTRRDAVEKGTDIKSTTMIVEMSSHRMMVADTDKGDTIRRKIYDLQQLLYAYRHGLISER